MSYDNNDPKQQQYYAYGSPKQQQHQPPSFEQQQPQYGQPNPYQSPYGGPQPYNPQYSQPQYGQPQYGQPQGSYGTNYGTNPQPYVDPSYQNNAYAVPQQEYAPPTTGYGAPPPHESGEGMSDGKFEPVSGYRDLLFLVLFVLHLGAVLVVLAFGTKSRPSDSSQGGADDLVPYDQLTKVLGVCFVGVVTAFVFAAFFLVIIRKYASALIHFTMIGSTIFSCILAIVGFASGNLIVGILFLFFGLINLLVYFFWRKRIPFATAVLKTVASLLQAYPAPTYYAYASLLVQIVWLVLWVPTFAISQHYSSTAGALVNTFLILSFYWTAQVIKNVVHVTTSGLFATWYFLSGVGMPQNPTQKAFKRSMTTSFGSICLGSLLVALLQTIRYLLRSLRRGNNAWIVCIVDCLLGIIESLVNYFNMYAFTQVAIYGKTYCQAAKDTWQLVKSHGVDAIVNDNLISGVLVMGAILGGVVSAIVGGLFALAVAHDYWVPLAIVCFFIGISLVMLAMEVVESGVATIFVCFAMEPRVLERNAPELYRMFTETYHLSV